MLQVAVGQKEQIIFPKLPLAVYKEIAAHLQQVDGVKTSLIPQPDQHFDYNQSQTGGLLVEYGACSLGKIEEILNYYAQIHGAWLRQALPD